MSCLCSWSLRMERSGQWAATKDECSRSQSMLVPTIVIVQQMRMQSPLLNPFRSSSSCTSGTSRPARWKPLRWISRTERATLRNETPQDRRTSSRPLAASRLKKKISKRAKRVSKPTYSRRKSFDGIWCSGRTVFALAALAVRVNHSKRPSTDAGK